MNLSVYSLRGWGARSLCARRALISPGWIVRVKRACVHALHHSGREASLWSHDTPHKMISDSLKPLLVSCNLFVSLSSLARCPFPDRYTHECVKTCSVSRSTRLERCNVPATDFGMFRESRETSRLIAICLAVYQHFRGQDGHIPMQMGRS